MSQPNTITTAQATKTVGGGLQTRNVPMISGDRRLYGVLPGRVLSFIRDTNPDIIGYDIYNLMRRYPVIYAALVLRKAPILAQIRKAQVKCDDEARREFVQRTMIDNGQLFRLAVTSFRAMEFGAAFHEIQWDTPDLELTYKTTDPDTGEEVEQVAWSGPALVFKSIHEVNPSTIQEIRRRTPGTSLATNTAITTGGASKSPATGAPQASANRPASGETAVDALGRPLDGSYDGFVQKAIGGRPAVTVEAVNSFVYTHDLEYGNMWGRPLTANAYPYYYWANAMMKLWMAWAEKKVIPPRVVYFPVGVSQDADGNQTDHASIALQTGNLIDGVAAVALPSDANDTSTVRQWDIVEKPVSDRTDIFEKIVNFLHIECLHSMFMPERVFQEGQYGTKAEAEAHFDTLLMVEDFDLADFLGVVNTVLLPRLIGVNFPDGPPVEITAPGLTDDARALIHTVLTTLLTNPEVQGRIDFDGIAESFGVPLKEIEPTPPPLDPLAVDPNAPPVDSFGNPVDLGAGAGANAAGLPANLVLSEADVLDALNDGLIALYDGDAPAMTSILDVLDSIQLAGDVNLSQYTITPDASSIIGYKVMKGDKRLSGFAARQVLKAFQNQTKKAAAAGAAAARKQAREAEAAVKKAQRDAATGARKQTAAQLRAARAAESERKKKEAEAKRQEKAGAREQTKAERDAERKMTKEQRDKARADRAAARDVAKEQRAADRTEADTVKDAERNDAAAVTDAKSQKNSLDGVTKNLDAKLATEHVKASGWDVHGTEASNHDSAVSAATAEATANPDRVYSIVKTKTGEIVISKSKKDLIAKRKATPGNIAADDAAAEAAYDSGSPDEVADLIFTRAAGTIATLFELPDPTDPDEIDEEEDDEDDDEDEDADENRGAGAGDRRAPVGDGRRG